MKIKLFVTLFLIVGVAKAQNESGVKFEKGLSWSQVQAKAKNENKYIFVDVFTTWCGPCKLMDRDIFPQEKVGEFFNEYFINVKVQADVTKKDTEEVKKWYNDAQAIASIYNIDSYPTYLFFDPKGELIHRLNGGSSSGEDFIAKAEVVLSGYPKQKRQFQNGNRDPEFLKKLTNSAHLMNDRTLIPEVTNAYLATQEDLLTEENLKFISSSTTKTTDPGFAVLRNNPDKADLVLGKGLSKEIVKTVVFDEVVLPHLRTSAVKEVYGGGMVQYTGEANEYVNWEVLEKKLNLEFPDLSEEIIMTSKPIHYKWAGKWPEFVSFISLHKDEINTDLLNRYANEMFLFCDDLKSITKALTWSKELIVGENKKKTHFLSTHANLLYKAGKKQEAIKILEEAVELSGGEESLYMKGLQKMKNNEKTW